MRGEEEGEGVVVEVEVLLSGGFMWNGGRESWCVFG